MSSQTSGDPDAPAIDLQPRRYRFVIGAMFAVVTITVAMSQFSVAPVVTLVIEDYDISRGAAGLLTSVVPLMHVLMGIPCSLLVGRLGPKTLVMLAALLASVPALSVFASSYYMLLATRIAYGFSLALLITAVAPLLMQRFRRSELPFMNGMFLVSISIGVSISSFIAPRIAAELGWKASLSLFGCAALVAAVGWQLVMLRESKDAPVSAPRLPFAMFLQVMRSRTTALLAAADAGPYALYTASLAWLPAFYHEVHGATLEEGGALTGLVSLTGRGHACPSERPDPESEQATALLGVARSHGRFRWPRRHPAGRHPRRIPCRHRLGVRLMVLPACPSHDTHGGARRHRDPSRRHAGHPAQRRQHLHLRLSPRGGVLHRLPWHVCSRPRAVRGPVVEPLDFRTPPPRNRSSEVHPVPSLGVYWQRVIPSSGPRFHANLKMGPESWGNNGRQRYRPRLHPTVEGLSAKSPAIPGRRRPPPSVRKRLGRRLPHG